MDMSLSFYPARRTVRSGPRWPAIALVAGAAALGAISVPAAGRIGHQRDLAQAMPSCGQMVQQISSLALVDAMAGSGPLATPGCKLR